MSYARRTDANHARIRNALRKAGVIVYDSSKFGRGFPDLICRHIHTGKIIFIEIKDGNIKPSARKLKLTQQAFARLFDVAVVLDVAQALAAVGLEAA